MRDTIKGVLLGAFVAAGVSVLLAQAPSWTAPRTWATDDLLTAAQFNAQIRDNFLNMRGFAACAENGTTGTSSALTVLYGDCRWAAAATVTIAALGCTGTANADTVLFGDCRWAELPTTTVVALDGGMASTTSSQFASYGPSVTIPVTGTQTVGLYLTGRLRPVFSGTCEWRVQNTTTDTTLDTRDTDTFWTSFLVADASPSTTIDNTYEVQARRTNTLGACWWAQIQSSIGQKGFIGVVL